MGDVEIGVEEYVVKRRREIDESSSRDIYAWLEERCIFKLGDQPYFFLTAGPAIEDELRPRTPASPSEGSDNASTQQAEADAELDGALPLPKVAAN